MIFFSLPKNKGVLRKMDTSKVVSGSRSEENGAIQGKAPRR
jgi:hypothetical protein